LGAYSAANYTSAGALPRTPLGELHSPSHLVGFKGAALQREGGKGRRGEGEGRLTLMRSATGPPID